MPEKKRLKPTAQQEAILDAFMTSKPMIVQALAGTGKTTTLQMLAEETDDIGLYVAFNRSVAAEARRRFPKTVDATTAHALAMHTLRRDDHWGPVIDAKFSANVSESGKAVYDRIIYPVYPHAEENYFKLHEALKIVTGLQNRAYLYYSNWGQLVAGTVRRYCQSADELIGAEHFSASVAARSINRHKAREVAKALSEHPKIVERTVELARIYWSRIIDPEDRAVKFGFDHALKVWQLSNPVLDYDFVMFDEAQDANATLSHVLLRQPEHGTQLVVVGDQNQAIYGFTGSLDAMKKFEEATPGALVLPLSESWRFGDPVADAANAVLRLKGVGDRVTGLGKDTEALREDPAGSLDFIAEGIDAVLCRSNQGCLDVALNVLEDRPDARLDLSVKLDEMEEFFRAALTFQNTGKVKYPVMQDYASWESFEAAAEQDADLKAEFSLLLGIMDRCGGAQQALDYIKRVNEAKAAPGRADLTITTVHQAKGAEWERVALYDDWTGGLNSDEERNLLYVATTRAKQRLYTGGFWPVFRHALSLTEDQLASILKKISGDQPFEDHARAVAAATRTAVVIGPSVPGSSAPTEADALPDPSWHHWAAEAEDLMGLRVRGIDSIFRGVYQPAYEEIAVGPEALHLSREEFVARFTEPAEAAIAHLVMDARDALRASRLPDGLASLGSAVAMLKIILRDDSGRAAAAIETAASYETPDEARAALCAALLDLLSRPAARRRVEEREDFAGAKDRRFARA